MASSPSAHPGTNSSLKRTVIVLTFAFPCFYLGFITAYALPDIPDKEKGA